MDFDKIGAQAAKTDAVQRKIVQGRELQYDADFACYAVANLEETVIQNYKHLLNKLEYVRQMAGCETIAAHITLGSKSGREAMATVKEYQEDRDPNTPMKDRVRELRHMLAQEPFAVYNLHYEADDMIVKRQHERIKAFGWDSTVIMSGDKDLWMGMGYHCDPQSGRLHMVKGYGETSYKEVGNVKPKLKGYGTSWFWHQMIMGDRVDGVPGLEKLTNRMLDKYLPLKSKKARKAGVGACGEAKAVAVLEGVTTDVEAAHRVYELYYEYYNVTATERFIEQAYLLWMQRNDNPFDVVVYLHNKCNLKINPTAKQTAIIQEFQERCST